MKRVLLALLLITLSCFSYAAIDLEKLRKERTEQLAKNKPEILKKSKAFINAGKFEEAHAVYGIYVITRDKDILELAKKGATLLEKKNQKIKDDNNAKLAPIIRTRLIASYEKTIQEDDSHLNFIKVKITNNKLLAYHDFYSQYTLSSGNTAKVIQNWINQNHEQLKIAKIHSVGVSGTGRHASSSWFDIK